jgi:hypothetical protein
MFKEQMLKVLYSPLPAKSADVQGADVKGAVFTAPRNMTAMKLMSRAARYMQSARFRPVGRQPELGGRKKDEGGALKRVVRGNKVGPTAQGMSNYDHRVAPTVDFS